MIAAINLHRDILNVEMLHRFIQKRQTKIQICKSLERP
jgi:hypothetical protein